MSKVQRVFLCWNRVSKFNNFVSLLAFVLYIQLCSISLGYMQRWGCLMLDVQWCLSLRAILKACSGVFHTFFLPFKSLSHKHVLYYLYIKSICCEQNMSYVCCQKLLPRKIFYLKPCKNANSWYIPVIQIILS